MNVRVIRSARRRRTLSARWIGEDIEVRVPASLAPAVAEAQVARLVERLTARRRPPDPAAEERALLARCQVLAARYLDGGRLPSRVRYVAPMASRWASTTPDTGEIRLSAATRAYPAWVRDYLLLHELAHFRVRGHGKAFWRLLGRYPRTERARGYLMAKGEAERPAGPSSPTPAAP
jgi:predicted metal-dependent hydrolase